MRERGRKERDTQGRTKDRRKRERERERERDRDRDREISHRERETETDSESERERESEGGTESEKKHVRHILCYKMYKTLHRMKRHTQSQSTFTFYLIKPCQPFNQTRTSTTQPSHIFTQVSISIVIFHTAHRATGSSSLVVYSKQYRISV